MYLVLPLDSCRWPREYQALKLMACQWVVSGRRVVRTVKRACNVPPLSAYVTFNKHMLRERGSSVASHHASSLCVIHCRRA